jgi:hypothetical protein
MGRSSASSPFGNSALNAGPLVALLSAAWASSDTCRITFSMAFCTWPSMSRDYLIRLRDMLAAATRARAYAAGIPDAATLAANQQILDAVMFNLGVTAADPKANLLPTPAGSDPHGI